MSFLTSRIHDVIVHFFRNKQFHLLPIGNGDYRGYCFMANKRGYRRKWSSTESLLVFIALLHFMR